MQELTRESGIAPVGQAAVEDCQARWRQIAKPLDSLGKLERALTRIAGATGDADYAIDRRAVLVLCADNGVVCQGVTQTGSEVTATLARGLAAGRMTVNKMAAVANADVIAVDVGLNAAVDAPGLWARSVGRGTADFCSGPAMTRQQAEQAVQTGIELVRDLKGMGYQIICTGEAGIGNTTTSSAVAAVLLGRDVEEVTGRGAGLSSDGLDRKIRSIRRGIEVNRPDGQDPMDMLSKLGGFDIAGLCGVFLGGAMLGVPVLVDGFISSVAALAALRLRPESGQCMLASHISAEPAGKLLLDALGLEPLICADMRLGEGTGAVAALPLLDMAYAVYREMPTFDALAIEAYQPLT